MKKIISLLLVMGIVFASMAQTGTVFPLIAGDTISTSASRDTMQKVIVATAGYSALGIQVNATKISGNVSAKAYLYGSIDGINYNLTDSSAAFANQTLNSAFFTKTTTPYVYYKVAVGDPQGATTSTQSVQVKVWYVLRRHSTN